MKYIKLISLVFFIKAITLPIDSSAQAKKIDSLKSALITAKEDTNKFRIYYSIAEEYWRGLKDTIGYSAFTVYEDSAYCLAKKLNYQYGIFDCLMCNGNLLVYQKKLNESKKAYADAIEVAKRIGDKKMIAETYLEMADNFFAYGNGAKQSWQNFPIALDYNFKALKLFEELGSKHSMARTWLFIGRSYAWQYFFSMGRGNLSEIETSALNAVKFFNESKETTDLDFESSIFLMGRTRYFQARYQEASEFFLKSLVYSKKLNNPFSIANTYLNLGRAYKSLGDSSYAKGNVHYGSEMLTHALDYLKHSLEMNKKLNVDGFIALCYLYIGEINFAFKKFVIAKPNLDSALLYTEKLNGDGTYQEIYQYLAKLDSAAGNFKSALENYQKYIFHKENNLNEVAIGESLLYKAKYEFEKKEDSLNQKQILTETNLKSEKKQKLFYWIGLGMLTLLFMLVFVNFRKQRKINALAKHAFAKEKTELELQALRAQLNPHFIFNCINSIDAFIHSNDKYNATVYLNKFAKLLRSILDSSKQNVVTFSKDIETLKLYIELEELRNENKFRTVFNVDQELMESDYKIPPLIIQPFIENAIIHGLKNKNGNDGLLEIDINKDEGTISYSIKDNGIGRKAAAQIVQNKGASYGMQLSYERIKLFNREDSASVNISDAANGGTTVSVKLKII